MFKARSSTSIPNSSSLGKSKTTSNQLQQNWTKQNDILVCYKFSVAPLVTVTYRIITCLVGGIPINKTFICIHLLLIITGRRGHTQVISQPFLSRCANVCIWSWTMPLRRQRLQPRRGQICAAVRSIWYHLFLWEFSLGQISG